MSTQGSRQVCLSRCPKSQISSTSRFGTFFPAIFPEFSSGTEFGSSHSLLEFSEKKTLAVGARRQRLRYIYIYICVCVCVCVCLCLCNVMPENSTIKIRSELPPPPPSKRKTDPPPLRREILWAWGFPAERTKKTPGAHKIGAPISGPRIAGRKITE